MYTGTTDCFWYHAGKKYIYGMKKDQRARAAEAAESCIQVDNTLPGISKFLILVQFEEVNKKIKRKIKENNN